MFPSGVILSESHGPGTEGELRAAEADSIRGAHPNRVEQFALGRACAHRALQQLGIVEFDLINGPDRAPRWPPGVVGSLTHTDGYGAAVVARRELCVGLGIDAENLAQVRVEVVRRLCTAEEQHRLDAWPEPVRARAAALLFCAKESFYKCQYPITGERLAFTDIAIDYPDPWHEIGSVVVRPQRALALNPAGGAGWSGQFCWRHNRIVTGFVLTDG